MVKVYQITKVSDQCSAELSKLLYIYFNFIYLFLLLYI